MSGLTSYREAERQTSQLAGFGIRQAGVQLYLTDAQVAAATTVQDLIDDVNNAVVPPGSEADSQRNSITRSLREGASLGDLSDARIQSVSTVAALANLTWASDTPDSYLGINLVP